MKTFAYLALVGAVSAAVDKDDTYTGDLKSCQRFAATFANTCTGGETPLASMAS